MTELPGVEQQGSPQEEAAASVLIAEDSPTMRAYLSSLLSEHWHVREVADGAAALAAAREQPPDLILSDVMMPGLSGFELVAALRADPVTSAIPVVLLTGRTGEESTVAGLEAGADDYLVKPFGAKELLARVRTHLELAKHREALARESAARAMAERRARQLESLQSIGDAALANLTLEGLLQSLADRIGATVEADRTALLLTGEDGELGVRATSGIEGAGGLRPDLAGQVWSAQRPLVLDPAREGPVDGLDDVAQLLGIPLFAEGRPLGELYVGRTERRPFGDDEVQLLQIACERVALAVERAQVGERERRLAETLHRSLLPERLPEIPGVELAARYVPGGARSDVGGDFYEAVALADGRLGVAIGDVAGHGLPAAGLMGQLRHGLRAYALEGASPADVLNRLDVLLHSLHSGRMVTLLYVILDPSRWSITFANAGHLAPLVIGADRQPRFIEEGHSGPLGVGARGARPEAEVPFEPPAALVLCTDGLVERRGLPLTDGLEHLAAATARAGGGVTMNAERLCAALLDSLLDAEGYDDSALLVVRALPFTPHLDLRLPARPEAMAELRQALRRWLEWAGADRSALGDMLIAAGEAAMNAVEHAYGPGDAEFEVSAELAHDAAVVTVRDRGGWRAPRGEDRGRGTSLMKALTDSMELERTEDGTTVVLRRGLRGPAQGSSDPSWS